MKILLIDGQGGRIGKQIAEAVVRDYPQAELSAVGTNSIATASMIKGGAMLAATGENAVSVGCREADIIVGPLGIVLADSMLGEITPQMAVAVGQSRAVKILIPTNKCGSLIAGSRDISLTDVINDAVIKIGEVINNSVNRT